MSKGLQWVIGISVLVVAGAFAFARVAPFFMPTTTMPMMDGAMMAQHTAMMNGGGMMHAGGMGPGMMAGGGMMGNFGGQWGLPLMGGGVLFLGLLLALALALGFWLGRRAVKQAQPVAVKEG